MNVTFDSETHTYTTDDKPPRVLPSVTQVLTAVGAYGPGARFWDDESAERGTLVHKLCAEYNCGTGMAIIDTAIAMPPFSDHPSLRAYLWGWIKFCAEYGIECHPDGIEAVVWDELLGYAGRVDLVAAEMCDQLGTKTSQECIIDIKTGSPCRADALQTEAYRQAWQHMDRSTSFTVPSRGCTYLKADGTYKFIRHTDHATDANAWHAALAWHNWRYNHNLLERRDDEH